MSCNSTIEQQRIQENFASLTLKEVKMDIQPSDLSIREYISAGAYDATNESQNCISQNLKPVPEYCPTPLSLEVHATLNYQPEMWTSNCQHCSKYAVDFDGNIFYVSHNETCLGNSGNVEQCFVYKPCRQHLDNIETSIDPITLNIMGSSNRCAMEEAIANEINAKPGEKRQCGDCVYPFAKKQKVDMCNCTTVQQKNSFENMLVQSDSQDSVSMMD